MRTCLNRLTMRLICCSVVVVLASNSLLASRSPTGDETDITSAEVLSTLSAYRQPARQVDLLEVAVAKLRELQTDIDNSTQMTDVEKIKWTRTVERRIRSLEKIAGRLERTAVEQSPDLTPSPSQSASRQNVPVGWRQSRSWQGGGLLPGGSWQGSQYQEVWGWSSQTGDRTANANSQNSAGNQQNRVLQMGFDKSQPLPANFDMPFNWPGGFPNGGIQNGGMQRSATGGGIMTGASSSSRSSRSGSSMSSRQSGRR